MSSSSNGVDRCGFVVAPASQYSVLTLLHVRAQHRSEGGEEQVDTTATITNLRWPAADKVGDEEGAFAALNASTQPTGAVDVAVEARALVAPQNAVGRT